MEFIIENWKWLVSVLLIVIETVLVIICKKRPVLKDNSLVYHLMYWIDEAEKYITGGSSKKAYVLNKASEYLGSDFDEKLISNMVEAILSLPQKKESKNEK